MKVEDIFNEEDAEPGLNSYDGMQMQTITANKETGKILSESSVGEIRIEVAGEGELQSSLGMSST